MSLNVFVEYTVFGFGDSRKQSLHVGVALQKNRQRIAVERGHFDVRAIAIGDGAAVRIFECVVGEAFEPPMKNGEARGAGAALQNDDALPKWTTHAPLGGASATCAFADVCGAVNDDVEELVFGGFRLRPYCASGHEARA